MIKKLKKLLFRLDAWLTKVRMRRILISVLKKRGFSKEFIKEHAEGMESIIDKMTQHMEEL